MLIGDHGINRAQYVHYKNPDHSAHALQIGDGIVSLTALDSPTIRETIPYMSFADTFYKTINTVTSLI